MVLSKVLDAEEEGLDISKRKDMENTVNKNPDDSPGVTSKMSESSSSVDFPPQAVITWLLVSVAVGLVTIYTMIQFISKKLTKEIGCKKEEGHKTPTDLSNQSSVKQTTMDYDLKTSEENCNISEGCSDSMIHVEKRDFNILDALENGSMETLETNESLVCEDTIKCKSNEPSVHMGTGFSGNFNLETKASKSEENAGERSCRSTATLEDNNLHHRTPSITVNNVQVKCFSCKAEFPQNNKATIHPDQHSTVSSDRHCCTYSPELTKDIDGGPDNHPASTINCIQTSMKCLNCEVMDSHADTKTVSESLNFLSNYHTPRETTDGLVLSKNTNEGDEFIFPQDNTTTEKQGGNISKDEEEVESSRCRTSRYLKYIRNDPAFSKSLDSQMEVLKKGCKLLDKIPSKSSLRSAGSEGHLEKSVHFPEDIRNIRTVHKYVSFDELWRRVDAEESAEKQQTGSLQH